MNNRTYLVLTEHESRVLRLVAQGLTNKEIAQSLGIAQRTVEFHLQKIFKKLNVTCRTTAAIAAIEMGLLRE